jgi:hypothetical protein
MLGRGRSTDASAKSPSGVQQGSGVEVNSDAFTDEERHLVEHYRQLDPEQQRILWNALLHLASSVPGARLVLAVER